MINYKEAVTSMKAAMATAKPGPAFGCGRAYVCISKPYRKGVKAACKDLGLMFLDKAYGVGDGAIYIGYDNATGIPLGQARAAAEVLRAAGIECYDDAASD